MTIKLTEGPTRPLANLNPRKQSPSQYYRLSKDTLQERAINSIFDNNGHGFNRLPTALKQMYNEHIYPKKI